MRILIVEDDPRISALLDQGMREEGYQVMVSPHGLQGLDAARSGGFDIIVLDLMLPGMDGYEVTRQLRKSGDRTPIIMLTARDSDTDAIRGLDLGADDYVTKPFSFDIFLARVRAVLRRGPVTAPVVLCAGDLQLDTGNHAASRSGRELVLAPREYRLLELLVRCSPRIVPRQTIMEEIWGFDSEVSENNLEAFVSQLRVKVDAGHAQRLIRTVRGVGYCVRSEEREE